jgi:hypothetical protein
MKGSISKTITLMLFLSLAISFATAQPLGVEDIDVGPSSRFNDTTTPTAVEAQAGNVTQLQINGTSVTRFWQGFYGNITGTIILADSTGNNFYDWNVTIPKGQVYASRNSAVSWTGVNCSLAADILAEETYLGHDATAPDSVSNTFAATNHPAFDLGSDEITGCPTTQAYDSSGGQGGSFWQVLLQAGSDMIYTSIIEDTSPAGFDGNPWHFQLLVGENGVGNNDPTSYYFYLELQ